MLKNMRAFENLKTKRITFAYQNSEKLKKVLNSDVVAAWQLMFLGFMISAWMAIIELLYGVIVKIH